MNSKILLLGMLIGFMGIISCKTNKNTATGHFTEGHNSMNSLDWAGTYIGNLPCTDCEGIHTVIKLNNDLSYMAEKKYIGKSIEVQHVKGTFSWDGSGNIINLEPENGPIEYFAVGENKLTQLDSKGKKISGENSGKYTLQKEMSGIVEKYWKLKEINGEPISPKNRKEAHMILKDADNRLVGNSGCNSFSGSYELKGNGYISFSKIASTKMGCPNMETEGDFFKVLEMTDSFTVQGDTLWLQKEKTTPLAKFEAVYLR